MKLDIMALNAELERQKTSKKDLVVESRLLKAEICPTQKVIKLDVRTIDDQGTQHSGTMYPLNEWAHGQLASKIGCPKNFYDKCNTEDHIELLAQIINEFIESKDRRMLRILDGVCRAIVSDRYKCLDNYELLGMAMEQFQRHEAVIHRCDLSETYMHVKALIPDMSVNLVDFEKTRMVSKELLTQHNLKQGDILQGGLLMSNSEVGASRFLVEPFILKVSCMNGMIGMSKLARVHLGSKHELGEIFSDRTLALEDETTWSQVRDVIDATFDKDVFSHWVDTKVMGKYKLQEWTREQLMNSMISAQQNTQWGLINAVTDVAKKCDYYDGQLELERVGGNLTDMSVEQFNSVIRQ